VTDKRDSRRMTVTLGSALAAVAAVVACWRGPARHWLLIAALSAIGVMVTYPLFFEGTNAAFVRGHLSDSEARSLLARWETWHWIRTGLGALGFVAALRALSSMSSELPSASV
jgi:sugar phosphate permease